MVKIINKFCFNLNVIKQMSQKSSRASLKSQKLKPRSKNSAETILNRF